MQLLKAICLQHALEFINARPVYGGDINEAFQLVTKQGDFFIKLNDAVKFPGMFAKEAEGLNALRKGPVHIPEIIGQSELSERQYLLLGWINIGTATAKSWEAMGAGLATLHKFSSQSAGWASTNFIGSLVQNNRRYQSWGEFFITQRVMPLVKLLRDKGRFSENEMKIAERFCDRTAGIFPVENHALLHGDLWSGNTCFDVHSKPYFLDPAVYYGHREMDIGMTKLFGGFPTRFYESYNEVFPLEKKWEERLPLSHLYPLLVHAILFGGGYVNQTLHIMQQFA